MLFTRTNMRGVPLRLILATSSLRDMWITPTSSVSLSSTAYYRAATPVAEKQLARAGLCQAKLLNDDRKLARAALAGSDLCPCISLTGRANDSVLRSRGRFVSPPVPGSIASRLCATEPSFALARGPSAWPIRSGSWHSSGRPWDSRAATPILRGTHPASCRSSSSNGA